MKFLARISPYSTWVKLAAVFIFLTAGLYAVGQLLPPAPPQLPSPPLRDLAAQHGISLGNFAIRSRLHEKPYEQILTNQFNLALVDNTPNWYFKNEGLRPAADKFNFKQMDEVVAYAEHHHMNVQAHHYLWGEDKWLPDWLKNGNFTEVQIKELMKQHILTVGLHYQGRVDQWTVVNEAFTRGQHYYGLRDWWADHAGGQGYIDDAFRWARLADPKSELILNDFANESSNRVSDAMYIYVKGALERGVPIDAIGMQMHIDGTHPPVKDEVIANMRRFAALGLDIYITEFDVNMHDVPVDTPGKDDIAAHIYYEMTRACIESKVCKSMSILGITDAETWYNYLGVTVARPLPFDENYRPKPAYYSLRAALEQK